MKAIQIIGVLMSTVGLFAAIFAPGVGVPFLLVSLLVFAAGRVGAIKG